MWKAIILLTANGLWARDRIAFVDFYGAKGMDIQAVRRALPFHEGDAFVPKETKRQAREAVRRVTGSDATDIAGICCDPNGDTYLFIGLAGESSKKFVMNAAPKGAERLSAELVSLQKRIEAAGEAATRKGGDAAVEDDSLGYALAHDAELRALQLQLRAYALQHEDELLRVAANSADALHREYAADALGYARQSARQIAALVHASRDGNADVRNDATRALGVLLEANAALTSQIPVETYIEMMSSGIWADRNKSCWVLDPMSKSREPKLLARLRREALDALIEMARWRSPGHSACGKTILARIGGAKEEDVAGLSFGPLEAVLNLLK